MPYQHWNNVVQRWKTVALTLHNIDLMFFRHWTPTLKIRPWTLFHFQRGINIISPMINNVETMLIWCCKVNWVVSMKSLILRNNSACNFTNKMKLVGIFRGLFYNIWNARFDKLLLLAASENSLKIGSFE